MRASKWYALRTCGLALAAAMSCITIGAADESQVSTVGVWESASFTTAHPYARTAADAPLRWEISYPGATYVRVHFSEFELAPGDRLWIGNASGGDAHVYEARGPHGTGEFWAFTVLGDTAVLQLEATSGGAFGVTIDGFGRGTVDIGGGAPAAPASVCGTQDWKDVKCYESSYPTEYARARGSVLALIGCCSACTALKVSDSGQFMTNNHCTSTQSGVQSTELRFEYQLPGCATGSASYSGSVMGSTLQKTDGVLDYTLMTTAGSSAAIPCLQLEGRLPPVGERIYIAGHPSGGVKKLSIESDQNAGGLCAVDRSPYSGNDPTSDIGYYCDTTNGSSGSPVFSAVSHKVVALHHFAGCPNSGGRMDRILPQISSLLGACTGGGGGATCGDGACNGTETSCTCSQDCGAAPTSEVPNSTCKDTKDNDCDGKTDCSDADCSSDPGCATCKPTGSSCTAGNQCCSNRCNLLTRKCR